MKAAFIHSAMRARRSSGILPLCFLLTILLTLGPILAEARSSNFIYQLRIERTDNGLYPWIEPGFDGASVAFVARDSNNEEGLFVSGETPGTGFRRVATENDAMPGTTTEIRQLGLISWSGDALGFFVNGWDGTDAIYLETDPGGYSAVAGADSGRAEPSGADGLAVSGNNMVLTIFRSELWARRDGEFTRLAAQGENLPGTTQLITEFSLHGVDIHGAVVVFSHHFGVFVDDGVKDGYPLVRVGDAAPGGGTFQAFHTETYLLDPAPSTDGENVAFRASTSDGRIGIFVSRGLERGSPIEEITSTSLNDIQPIDPNYTETVFSVEALGISEGKVAFLARDSLLEKGAIYSDISGSLERVIGTGDELGAREIVDLGATNDLIEGKALAFGIQFPQFDTAIYVAEAVTTAEIVSNGFFYNGLDDWVIDGDAGVSGTHSVELTADSSSTTISQGIETPVTSYYLALDYRFLTTAGSLEVLIDGVVVYSVEAPDTLQNDLVHDVFLVNDPALMGLEDANIEIRLNPGSLARAIVDAIYFWVIESSAGLLSPNHLWYARSGEVAVWDGVTCPATETRFSNSDYDQDPPNNILGSVPALLSANVDTSWGTPADGATSRGRGIISFGLEWGAQSRAASTLAGGVSMCGGSRMFMNTGYRINAPGLVGQPIPLDFTLSLEGTVELSGNFDANAPDTAAILHVPLAMAVRSSQLQESGVPDYADLEFKIIPAQKEPVYSDFSYWVTESTNVPVITEERDNDDNVTLRRYEFTLNETLSGFLHGEHGQDVRIMVPLYRVNEGGRTHYDGVKAIVDPEFEGYVDIDFLDTAVLTVSSSLQGVELIDENVPVINPGLNDAWYNPDTAGQGALITVLPTYGKVFLAMFTFDTERPGDEAMAILGAPGHRWLTAIGDYAGNRATLDIELTAGGVFNSDMPLPMQTPGYGTFDLVFNDCASATLMYTFPGLGLEGAISLERVVGDNVALCESLANP